MNLDMQQMQKYVNEMLKATIDVCEKNNITWYCQAGTVLGTVRHGGSIPWDHDADIIIPNNEIDNFVACCQRDLPKEYYVDYFTINPKELCLFPRIGLTGYSTNVLHLDVFRLIGLPDSAEEQHAIVKQAKYYNTKNSIMWQASLSLRCYYHRLKMFYHKRTYFAKKFNELCNKYPYKESNYVMNPSGKYGEKNIFEKSVYGEGILMKYEGFTVRIPSKTDFYLRQYYGDYMQTPPQAEIDKEMNKIFVIK